MKEEQGRQENEKTGISLAEIFFLNPEIKKGLCLYAAVRYCEWLAEAFQEIAQLCFSTLQRLGWVESSGYEEPSSFQDNYPPGPSRKYYRLTPAGLEADDASWFNPHSTLYG